MKIDKNKNTMNMKPFLIFSILRIYQIQKDYNFVGVDLFLNPMENVEIE